MKIKDVISYFKFLITKDNFNVSKTIAILMIIAAIVIAAICPWFVQFILNTLFLITSFVVFTIIYAIILLVRELYKSFHD